MKTRLGTIEVVCLVLLFCISVAAEYFDAFSILESQAISFRHALRSSHGDRREMTFPIDKIVLVTIDEYFFQKYGRAPLRRKDLAKIISNLNTLGARVICVDLFLDLPDAYGEDLILASALRESRSILASRLVFSREGDYSGISYPTPRLRAVSESGYVNMTSPSVLVTVLGRLRIHPEAVYLSDGWPMAVKAAAAYLNVTPRLQDDQLILGERAIPLNQFSDIRIDFSTIPSGYRFIHELAGITAHEFLDISFLNEESLRELRDWVAGKIVIIGETSALTNDWFNTPVGGVYGAEIIADSINTILKGAPLRPAPLWAEALTSLFALILVVWLSTGIRTMGLQLVSAIFLPSLFLFFSAFIYVRYGIIIGVVNNLIMGFLVYFVLNIASSHREKILRISAQEQKELAQREQRSAEAASRQKSEFLANMSHEIRTPMNAILGFTEILEETAEDPQHRQYLSIIRTSGRSLMMLINDILDLSKIEAGKVALEMRPTKMRPLFQEIEMMFRSKASEKGIDFQFRIDPQVPDALEIDEPKWRQILLNLIGNAVKFTETGYVRITVHATASDAGAPMWDLAISIEDTGIGIPESQAGRIFEAFEQQEGQNHARYGGTGLGLAITRRLVEMMGGSIALHSAAGAGAEFRVLLPGVKQAAPEAVPAPERSVPPEAYVFEAAKILVAEDVPVNRELIREFLRDYALEVIEAEDGEAAVDLARAHRPDLVLMDMRMPGIDGYEAVRRIREDAGIADTPVIAVSASTLKEEIGRIREVCDAYLGKPVRKEALVRTLARFLACRTASPEKPEAAAPSAAAVISDEAGPPPVDQQQGEQWRTLSEILERRLQDPVCRAGGAVVIDRVEALGRQMKALGRMYAYPRLSEWADKLLHQAEHIDVKGLPKTLAQLPRIVEALRGKALPEEGCREPGSSQAGSPGRNGR
jgi:signal transduction histidine kinase/CheY-like chemotaxis protein